MNGPVALAVVVLLVGGYLFGLFAHVASVAGGCPNRLASVTSFVPPVVECAKP